MVAQLLGYIAAGLHVISPCDAADNTEEEEKQEPSWSSTAETDWAEAVAAAAAAQPGTSGAAGQGGDQAWNWPWGSAQHALQGGFLDPDALLDDESEGKLQCWLPIRSQMNAASSFDLILAGNLAKSHARG